MRQPNNDEYDRFPHPQSPHQSLELPLHEDVFDPDGGTLSDHDFQPYDGDFLTKNKIQPLIDALNSLNPNLSEHLAWVVTFTTRLIDALVKNYEENFEEQALLDGVACLLSRLLILLSLKGVEAGAEKEQACEYFQDGLTIHVAISVLSITRARGLEDDQTMLSFLNKPNVNALRTARFRILRCPSRVCTI